MLYLDDESSSPIMLSEGSMDGEEMAITSPYGVPYYYWYNLPALAPLPYPPPERSLQRHFFWSSSLRDTWTAPESPQNPHGFDETLVIHPSPPPRHPDQGNDRVLETGRRYHPGTRRRAKEPPGRHLHHHHHPCETKNDPPGATRHQNDSRAFEIDAEDVATKSENSETGSHHPTQQHIIQQEKRNNGHFVTSRNDTRHHDDHDISSPTTDPTTTTTTTTTTTSIITTVALGKTTTATTTTTITTPTSTPGNQSTSISRNNNSSNKDDDTKIGYNQMPTEILPPIIPNNDTDNCNTTSNNRNVTSDFHHNCPDLYNNLEVMVAPTSRRRCHLPLPPDISTTCLEVRGNNFMEALCKPDRTSTSSIVVPVAVAIINDHGHLPENYLQDSSIPIGTAVPLVDFNDDEDDDDDDEEDDNDDDDTSVGMVSLATTLSIATSVLKEIKYDDDDAVEMFSTATTLSIPSWTPTVLMDAKVEIYKPISTNNSGSSPMTTSCSNGLGRAPSLMGASAIVPTGILNPNLENSDVDNDTIVVGGPDSDWSNPIWVVGASSLNDDGSDATEERSCHFLRQEDNEENKRPTIPLVVSLSNASRFPSMSVGSTGSLDDGRCVAGTDSLNGYLSQRVISTIQDVDTKNDDDEQNDSDGTGSCDDGALIVPIVAGSNSALKGRNLTSPSSTATLCRPLQTDPEAPQELECPPIPWYQVSQSVPPNNMNQKAGSMVTRSLTWSQTAPRLQPPPLIQYHDFGVSDDITAITMDIHLIDNVGNGGPPCSVGQLSGERVSEPSLYRRPVAGVGNDLPVVVGEVRESMPRRAAAQNLVNDSYQVKEFGGELSCPKDRREARDSGGAVFSSSSDESFIPHGWNFVKYADGTCYKGMFDAGCWHGFGHVCYANGDCYQGEHRMDAREGPGIYQWRNGDIYNGTFQHNEMHGTGMYCWPCGAKYQGQFKNGARHGRGVYTSGENGDTYKGTWRNGQCHGYGEYTWGDGWATYQGEFRSGKRHGLGRQRGPGEIVHDGMFHKNNAVLAANDAT